MGQIFAELIYRPIYNLLIFFYNVIPGHDMGVAIILVTVALKLIMYPLSAKSIKSQKEMQRVQPLISELQKKYKDQKEKLSQELMALYKKEKVNPFSSCLPLLIQFPFLIAVFQVFRTGIASDDSLKFLYPFITNPGHLNSTAFFGTIDLLAIHNVVLALLAGIAQYYQAKMLVTKKPPMAVPGSQDEKMTAMMNKQMLYMMPVITVVIGYTMPTGLVLYWFLTTALTALQQVIIFRKNKKTAEIVKVP